MEPKEWTKVKKLFWGAVTVLALGAAACGAGDDPAVDSSSAGAPAGTSQSVFNDADVEFVQQMIPHHEGAIAMAAEVEKRGQSPEVKDLAGRISAAQTTEIKMMRDWLGEWGAEEKAGDHGGGHGGGDAAADKELDSLRQLSGRELDRKFLETMVPHHEGAIDMAEVELKEGKSPDALALAEQIVETQSDEIEEIKGLLSDVG